MSINNYFDKIYCINLARRYDRWEDCIQNFKKHRIIADRFEGMDGKSIVMNYDKPLSPGEYGCLISHLNIINDAVINNYDKILIFEDDIELHNDFSKIAEDFMKEVPDNWDMLYFGANTARNQNIKVSNRVNMASSLLTTHAYAIKSTVFHYLIDKILNGYGQIDKIYSDNHIYMNTYMCNPIIAWQKDGWSDVNNTFVDYNFLRENV